MSLVPQDSFDVFMPLRDAMNRLFEESVIGPRVELFTGRTFPIDVYEAQDKQHYVIEAALPGLKPEDVQITVMNDILTIRVTKKSEEKVEKGNYIRQERYEGEMSRSITLPTTIDADKVQATYEHGVLTIHIPRADTAKPKQISISAKEVAGTR
ncbi:MAG TPA: Hsp20/alpha crystallin family protein [Ktedonobacter sp.]|nr:Hsp20/alpha crystallin family protein [Ktedonobacter sp.]